MVCGITRVCMHGGGLTCGGIQSSLEKKAMFETSSEVQALIQGPNLFGRAQGMKWVEAENKRPLRANHKGVCMHGYKSAFGKQQGIMEEIWQRNDSQMFLVS